MPNAYKGTFSAKEVAESMRDGIKNIFPEAQCTLAPVADGGDGTIDIISSVLSGKLYSMSVPGPLNDQLEAAYFCLDDEETAVIELAQASGIQHLKKLDALSANTYGTGLLINEALKNGGENIILTVGGSASTDGGTGILAAAGAKFFDSYGKELLPCGGNLSKIEKIDLDRINPLWRQSIFKVACDVNNPLFGPDGAAFVFAPQKGANFEQVKILDEGLRHFGELLAKSTGSNTNFDFRGAGAAGGVPFALACVFGAQIISGFDWISSIFDLQGKMHQTDIVITGEGSFDQQSLQGKATGKILEMCRHNNKALWIFPAGINESGYDFVDNAAQVFPVQKISGKKVGLHDISKAVEQACLRLKQTL